MQLLILNMLAPDTSTLVETWCGVPVPPINPRRPSVAVRRLVTLAMARSLLNQKTLEIQREESGRPHLSIPGVVECLPAISISHSGTWVACLLADAEPYRGIDIEDMTIPRSHNRVAKFAFSEAENRYMEEAGSLGFYRLWTAKEAIAKCQGKGLSVVLGVDLGTQLTGRGFDEDIDVTVDGFGFRITQSLREPTVMVTIAWLSA